MAQTTVNKNDERYKVVSGVYSFESRTQVES
jgi:hypothetical protein